MVGPYDLVPAMSWLLRCSSPECKQPLCPPNIVDLLRLHRHQDGWFLCGCGNPGSIKKEYPLQERGEVWAPFLRGAITLGDSGDTYQPFVFLVSYRPDGEVTDVWFCYYKDLRGKGGRLKLGYGPGGPPVLNKPKILNLLKRLGDLGYLAEKHRPD